MLGTALVGDYTLSSWCNEKVQHCYIHWRQDAGSPTFFLTDIPVFDSLCDLIAHCQEMLLRYNKFEMRLTEPVPQSNTPESKERYHANRSSAQLSCADAVLWDSTEGMSPAPAPSPSGWNGQSTAAACSRTVTLNKALGQVHIVQIRPMP